MANESQKRIEALKKAYAEIILNTSREAAARVMVADRKARCFEQQFVSLKQESVSMLLRLKDHFHSMIMEAEARSVKQQMKIEELEAQLCEAEEIIIDIRGELALVQEQLEIARHNQKKPLNERILVTDDIVQECVLQDNSPNSSAVPQVSDSKSVLVDDEKKAECLLLTSENNFFHTINPTNLSLKSCLNQFHARNDDFSSIIMQNRETDLCRIGCTQRIRAFEGNLSNVKLPISQSEDQKFVLNIQPTSYAKETVKCRQYASDNVESSEDSLCYFKADKSNAKTISLGQLLHRSSSYKDQAIRSPRRSARKNARYREAIASLQGSRKKFERTRLQPLCAPLKGCSSGVNVQATEIPIEIFEMDPKLKECSTSMDAQAIEIPIELIEMDPKKIKDFHVTKSCDLSCNSKKAVCTVGGNDAITREATSQKFHIAPVDSLLDSMLIDVPISEGYSSNQLSRDRFLKFTFKRKNQKNVLGKIDENILHDRNTKKKKMENSSGVVENDLLNDGMHRDGEKMKQVAHQMFSLTGADY